jgi:protein neuralized
LWAIFDIYGNTKQIEFVDPMSALPSEVQMISRNTLVPPDPINDSNNTGNDSRKLLLICYKSKSPILAIRFSRLCGPTVEVDTRQLLATRVGHEFSQAYVFSNRPIRMDEDITVIVMKNTPEFMGSMAFGLTSCDPATIGDMSTLPADSDNLLERPE